MYTYSSIVYIIVYTHETVYFVFILESEWNE